MSSCPDLRNQLAKCKRPLQLLQELADFNGSTQEEFKQFKQEFYQAVGNEIEENADQLKKMIHELDYEGSLDLSHITDHTQLQEKNGFIFPGSISDSLYLNGLTSAEGLVLPKIVDLKLVLSSLTNAKGLVLPKEIGYEVELNGLTSAEGLVLPKKIDYGLDLSGLADTKGLVLPEEIRRTLQLDGLTSAEGLILPKKIGGEIYLLKSVYNELTLKLAPEELERYKFNLR